MAKRVVLTVGTRKGCFLLESDEERRDWQVRGPFCDGWPIYHALLDPDSGRIYASAASEWHGAGVWRSADLGETWELSSEGIGYPEGELKLSRVSGLAVAHGKVRVGAEAAGVFESGDGGATWSLLSTLDGEPGRDSWNDPAKQPPGHLGMTAILPHPDDPGRYMIIVQGYGIFETADGGGTWEPLQHRASGRVAARGRAGRLLRPQARDVAGRPFALLPAKPLRDAPKRRRRPHLDGGDGRAADRLRLRRRRAPARPRQLLRDPARPGPRPHDARRRGGRLANERRRLDLAAPSSGLPQQNAHLGVLREGLAIDSLEQPGLYFGTSTGQVFASADEGESWSEVASYLPGISSVEVAAIDA